MTQTGPGAPPELDLVFIGFGNVGRRLAGLLGERGGALSGRDAFAWRITGIATARHGVVHAPGGIDAARAVACVEGGASLDTLSAAGTPQPAGALALIGAAAAEARRTGRHVVTIETTVLDIPAGQAALEHVRRSLDAG